MQQFTNSAMQIHPQHQQAPAGWDFPTVPATPPARQPVTGGGLAPATVARVRWGRVLPLIAGAALLLFGAWAYTNPGSSAPASDVRAVGGGGVEIASSDAATADLTAPAATIKSPNKARAATTGTSSKAAKARSARRAKAARKARAARQAKARSVRRAAAAAATLSAAPAAAATAAPATIAGGGAATSELPMTGIETWIAGGLGILLLLIGIAVQINAVRIAATALLYRRGILLRPMDCARIAQSSALPRARMLLSNALLRLLEDPSHDSGFVGSRIGR